MSFEGQPPVRITYNTNNMEKSKQKNNLSLVFYFAVYGDTILTTLLIGVISPVVAYLAYKFIV